MNALFFTQRSSILPFLMPLSVSEPAVALKPIRSLIPNHS